MSARDGGEIRPFSSATFPVLSGNTAVLSDDNPTTTNLTLRAVNATTGSTVWTRRPAVSIYGSLVGGPIATGTVVYARNQSGMVFGFDLATGRDVWRGDAGVPLQTMGTNSGLVPGMTIGDGALGVATNHYIALVS